MTVYLDLAILLDLTVDFLLLLAADRLAGFPGRPLRILAGAGLGAAYCAAALLFPPVGSLPLRILWLGIMGAAAYGWSPAGLRRTGIFLLLSLALGGMAVGFQQARFVPLILEAGLLLILSRAAFGEGIGQKCYVPVTLQYQGRTVRINALVDTGNSLRDPITGEPVLVASWEIGQILTGLTEAQFRDPVKTLCQPPLPGLRLIPCTTAGGSTMLLALRIPEARIGSTRKSALVAFAPEGLGQGRMYEALTGGAL